VQEEQLLTTQGATQGLHLVIQELLHSGDRIIVEDPTYPPLLALLRARGVKLEAIARNGDGPDLTQLRKLLRRRRPRFLFTNSALHNPLAPAPHCRLRTSCSSWQNATTSPSSRMICSRNSRHGPKPVSPR